MVAQIRRSVFDMIKEKYFQLLPAFSNIIFRKMFDIKDMNLG